MKLGVTKAPTKEDQKFKETIGDIHSTAEEDQKFEEKLGDGHVPSKDQTFEEKLGVAHVPSKDQKFKEKLVVNQAPSENQKVKKKVKKMLGVTKAPAEEDQIGVTHAPAEEDQKFKEKLGVPHEPFEDQKFKEMFVSTHAPAELDQKLKQNLGVAHVPSDGQKFKEKLGVSHAPYEDQKDKMKLGVTKAPTKEDQKFKETIGDIHSTAEEDQKFEEKLGDGHVPSKDQTFEEKLGVAHVPSKDQKFKEKLVVNQAPSENQKVKKKVKKMLGVTKAPAEEDQIGVTHAPAEEDQKFKEKLGVPHEPFEDQKFKEKIVDAHSTSKEDQKFKEKLGVAHVPSADQKFKGKLDVTQPPAEKDQKFKEKLGDIHSPAEEDQKFEEKLGVAHVPSKDQKFKEKLVVTQAPSENQKVKKMLGVTKVPAEEDQIGVTHAPAEEDQKFKEKIVDTHSTAEKDQKFEEKLDVAHVCSEDQKFKGKLDIAQPSAEKDQKFKEKLSVTQAPSEDQKVKKKVKKKLGVTKASAEEDQKFKDNAQNISAWIDNVRAALNGLKSVEGSKAQLVEKTHQMMEIISLKDEGDAKIKDLKRTKMNGNSAVQQTILDLQKEWEQIMHSATEQHSFQEQILHQRDRYMQDKKDLRLRLAELQKKQELICFDPQFNMQEKQAQLINCKNLLQEAECLTSALNDLKLQGEQLLDYTQDSCFGGELWLEIKHLHEHLLIRLQDLIQKLEYQDYYKDQNQSGKPRSEVDSFPPELLNGTDVAAYRTVVHQKMQNVQELEGPLGPKEETSGMSSITEAVKQNATPLAHQTTKNETEHTGLSERQESVKQVIKNIARDSVKTKHELFDITEDKENNMRKEIQPGTQILISTMENLMESSAIGKADGIMDEQTRAEHDDGEEPLKMQHWLQRTRIELDTYQKSPCDEDKLAEKISNIQAIHADILQKQIELDMIASKHETVERLAKLEGRGNPDLEMQEARNQLQKLLLDCDSYKRQLESLQTALGSCYIHLHQVPSLLNSIQLKMNEDKQPSSDYREIIVADVQPLYDEVQHHFGYLDTICSQALSLKVSNNAEKERKKVREKWEPLMMHLDKELIYKKPFSSESQASAGVERAEQKVVQLKNRAIELDIALANEQIEEVEKMYHQCAKKKDEALCLKKDSNLPSTEHAISQWDRLLHELSMLKANKERLRNQVKGYHDALNSVQSSVKTLSIERENIKLGPINSSVCLLERIQQFMTALLKEKCGLKKLKIEQENVSKYLPYIDKKVTENQMKRLEQWWEHTEQSTEKKHHQLVAEVSDFNFYMGKIENFQRSIQGAQKLLDEYNSAQGEENKASIMLTTQLQAIKSNFFHFKDIAELQMKRIWGQQERDTLGYSINNLQKQLEVLEEQAKDKDETTNSNTKKSEFMRSLKETNAWIKDSHKKIIFDHTVRLFPDSVQTQINSYKSVQSDIPNHKATIESLANEAKHFVLEVNQQEAADISNTVKELQDSYQALVTKSPQRLQQLESGLEKRERLFAEIEKLHSWVHHLETMTMAEASKQITRPELDQQIQFLKEKAEELKEIEGLLSSLLKDSQDTHKELNIFEQMFLAERLSNLKNVALRLQRLLKSKSQQADEKLGIYMELSSRICALEQELNDIMQDKLEVDWQTEIQADQDIERKLRVAKDRILEVHSTLSQISKYKEIFEYAGLAWDTSPLEQLHMLYLKVKADQEEKVKRANKLDVEYNRYQALKSKIKILITNIKKEVDMVTKNSDLEATQLLCHKVRKVIFLIQETENQLNTTDVFDASWKEIEVKEMKGQLGEMDRVHQLLCNRIAELQPKYASDRDTRSKLEDNLCILQQSQSELQQPLLIDLDVNQIENEKLKCEALEERIKEDMCFIKSVPSEEQEGLKEILHKLNDQELQFMTQLSSHMNSLNETLKTIKKHEKAAQRAAKLLNEFEANVLINKVDLDVLEHSPLQSLLNSEPQKEQFESTVAELQEVTCQLEKICNPTAKQQLQSILQEVTRKQIHLTEDSERYNADLTRYFEKYQRYKETKQNICANLSILEKTLRESFSRTSKSYKDALQQLEQSKALVIKTESIKEDLTKLRQDSRDICAVCKERDSLLVMKTVSVLWDRWLYLLETAKEWEVTCEEVKQHWKFVNEEIEREMIILDNFHEELPGGSEDLVRKDALLESLACINRYEENIARQELLLLLLLHHVKVIWATSENSEETKALPAVQDIQSMEEKCKNLCKKIQKRKQLVQSEIQNRDQIKEEIKAVMDSLLNTSSCFQNLCDIDPNEKATRLTELQDLINKEKLKIDDIMEKLRIKYSNMDTILPEEIETQVEECKRVLQDMDNKVKDEVLQSSPQYMMNKKVEEINNGLQTVEKMLQQKSENLVKAKEIQKKIWDELDHWHSRLNELDSEVQDFAEEDPDQAQTWMDSLMSPHQLYQQVSKRSERRTALLNKGASKMEECDELLKNIKLWIENTNNLLTGETKYDSAKSLSKHASALQMALEDSEQKQNILHDIYTGLDELSIFETNITAERIDELNSEVALLQQKIMGRLPQLQHIADDVAAIEMEVKVLDKRVSTIKTILSSTDVVDISPLQRLKHGHVILENIDSMKKTIADIEDFKAVLNISDPGVHCLSVFRKTFRLSKCMAELEKITEKHNELVEPVIKEVAELDQELEKLKQVSKNLLEHSENTSFVHTDASSQENSEVLDRRKRLNERKEEVLMSMQNLLMELLSPLQQEDQETEDDSPLPQAPEDTSLGNRDMHLPQLKMKGSLFLLPSLAEETEESSFSSEKEDEAADEVPSICPQEEEHHQNSEDTKTDDILQLDTRADSILQLDTRTDGIPWVDTRTDGILQLETRTDGILQLDTRADDILRENTGTDDILKLDTGTDGIPQLDKRADGILQVDTGTDGIMQLDTRTDGILQVEARTDGIPQLETRKDGIQREARTDGIPQLETRKDGIQWVDTRTDGIPQLETRTDGIPRVDTRTDGILQVDTRTDGISQIETRTDGIPRVDTRTDGIPQLDTRTDDSPRVDTRTDGIPQLVTRTDGIPRVDTRTDGIPQLETRTDGIPRVDTRTDVILQLVTRTDDSPWVDTRTDGFPQLESRTDGIPRVDTRTDGILQLDTRTDDSPRLETRTGGRPREDTRKDGIQQLETRTDGIPRVDTRTDGIPQLETRTDGFPQVDTRTDGIPRVDTRTDGIQRVDTRTDGILQLETRTDGSPWVDTRKDGILQLETRTDGIPRVETRTDGIDIRTAGSPQLETRTDDIPRVDTRTAGIPQLVTRTDGIPRVDTRKDGILQLDTRTDDSPRVDTRTDGIPQLDTRTDGIPRVDIRTAGSPWVDTRTDGIPQLETRSDDIPRVETRTDGIPQVDTRTDGIPQLETRTDGIPWVDTRTDGIPQVDTRTDGILQLDTRTYDSPRVETRTDGIDTRAAGIPQLETRTDGIPRVDTRRDGIPRVDTRKDGILQLDTRTDGIPRVDTRTAGSPWVETRTDGIPRVDTRTAGIPQLETRTDGIPWVDTRTDGIPQLETRSDDIPRVETRTDGIPRVDTRTAGIPQLETRTDGIPWVDTRKDGILQLDTRTDGIPRVDTRTDGIPQLETRSDDIPRVDTRTDGIPQLETRTDGIPRVETRTDGIDTRAAGIPQLETRTDGIPRVDTRKDGILQLDTRTDGIPRVNTRTAGSPWVDTRTDGIPQLETRTEGIPRVDTRTDGIPRVDTRTDGSPRVDTRKDGILQLETRTDGIPRVDTREDGILQLETRTDGIPWVDTRTDGIQQLDNRTDGSPRVYTRTDGRPQLETRTAGSPRVETRTDGIPQLETRTDGIPRVDTRTDGIPQLETRTDGILRVETRTDGIPRVDTRKDGIPGVDTRTDGIPQLETRTDGILRVETRTDGIPRVDTRKDSILQLETRTDGIPGVDTRTDGIPRVDTRKGGILQLETRTDGIPGVDTRTDGIPQLETRTDGILRVETRTDGIPRVDTRKDGILQLETRTDGIPGVDTRTDGIPQLETRTDGILRVETRTDGIPRVDTRKDGILQLETRTDGIPGVDTMTDGIPRVATREDGILQLETRTDGIPGVDTRTDGIPQLETRTDCSLWVETMTDGIPRVDTRTDGIPQLQTRTDGIPWVDTRTDGILQLETRTDDIPLVDTRTDGILRVDTGTYGIQQGEQENSEKTVDSIKETEPEEIRHVCWAQVAELELWLEKVKLLLTTYKPNMQQQVEQQITDCQMKLKEIEQKVSLLGEGISWFHGTHREDESLTLKLNALKSELEKVQVMLQDKPSEEQVVNGVEMPSEIGKHPHITNADAPALSATSRQTVSKQNSLHQQKDLQMELHEQQDLTKHIAFYGEKMENQQLHDDSTTQDLHSRSEVPVPDKDVSALSSTSKDYKWQYLQTELSSKMKTPPDQHAGLEVTSPEAAAAASNICTLPRIPVFSFKYPTAEEVKSYCIQLGDLSKEEHITQTQKTPTVEASSTLEGKLFELFGMIIHCLNNLEEMFNMSTLSSEDAMTQLAHQEALSAELGKLHTEMMNKKDVLLKSLSGAGRTTDVICQCFNNIQAWLKLTHAVAISRSKSMKARLDQSCNYQNEIRTLYDTLTDKKSILHQPLNAKNGQSVEEQLQIANMNELELQDFESRVTALKDKGERLQIPVSNGQEVYKLEEALNDAWRTVRARQLDLNSALIRESLCERLLHGIAELVNIGEEKLKRSHSYRAKSKAALQLHLQNHKDFFHNLNNHVLLMQTFTTRIPPFVFSKKQQFWTDLSKQFTLLQERAVQYGIGLQCLLKDWTEFDADYASLSRELATLGSAVPSVSLVDETEERLLERISLFQQIMNNIDAKNAKLYETVREGKKLVAAVNCPELESQISKLEEQWLSFTRGVHHDLHKLQALLKHLICYNKESNELSMWLKSAYQRLNYWKQESLHASQDLDTVKSNIDSFYEFSREVDEKSSFKTSVISTGNQLVRLKETDTAMLRSSLEQFEQKWTDLITQIPTIHDKLHELQMDKLPSRKAIADLMVWVNRVDQQMKDKVPINSESSTSQLKDLLQEYKEHRKKMNHRQWIVEFVNQSLLQQSVCDVESNRYDRTEFAEYLGTLNLHWHKLQGSLNKKIQDLEQRLEHVTENENRVQTLSSWFDAQGDKLITLQKPSNLISAQDALMDCEDLEKQLALKSSAIDDLKQNLQKMGNDNEELLPDMEAIVNDLYEKKNDVTNKVMLLKSSLQSVLQYWKIYVEAFEKVQVMTSRLLYYQEHNKPHLLSLEALRNQVKNLQFVVDEAENNEGSWVKLQAAVNNLKNDSCSSAIELIEQKYKDAYSRWTQINQDTAKELQSAKALLQLLENYTDLYTTAAFRLEQLEEEYSQLSSSNVSEDNMMETLRKRIQDVHDLQQKLQNVKMTFLQISELVDQLVKEAGPMAPDIVLSDRLRSSQRIFDLERRLSEKSNEFKFTINQLEEFNQCLKTIEAHVKTSSDDLDELYLQDKDDTPEPFMAHLLALVALSPDIENLNEKSFRLPLSDISTKALQNLNRQWTQKIATALERCSELQRIQIEKMNFDQKYENWMKFLKKMEDGLSVDIAGKFEVLQQQQMICEMFQAEIFINQQILNSDVTKALHLLESGEVGDRTKFILKLTALKGEWQPVIKKVQQRKRDIDRCVKHWQHFSTSQQNLTKCLIETKCYVSTVNDQDCHSLCQLKKLIHDFKNKEIHLQTWKTDNWLVEETSKQVLAIAEPETEATLQKELSQLQDDWKDVESQVERMLKQLSSISQTWENCEKQIKELDDRIQDLKLKINVPLPEMYEDLQRSKEQDKELEESLADWNRLLEELSKMKTDLSHYIIAEDVIVLKEQVEYLHRQWEELCLRVAVRKQEIEDRLNAWTVFDEKNNEVCQWLTQMENKVLQTADINIEEMIEKLEKECVEEIKLRSENKLHLKQMGDELMKVSNATKSTEVEKKLNKINDRWQHLFDVIGARVKKLKETFIRIQQLEKEMSNLRTWLTRIESELSKPVVYDICDDQEIKKKLAEQQDLQQDIEQHRAGVASVLNICEGLLNDSDACANETECDSIQQTTRSLDRRWRNICAMSMQRRMKIEETWQLWQKFLDDYLRFEDWLNAAERTAASPNSAEVLYTSAKEELKKFEAFQRQIHERLTQLELINKQYRRLARENRTDSASKLKQMVHEGNQRWDNLQKRVAAILRRLKHFTNRKEEFEGTRDSILVWLTEMDLQLTNVEHFSESDIEDKKRQLNGFQREIALNINKIDQLIGSGELLIQKSEPIDAVLIEDEIDELLKYRQEVFGRVSRFHQRLTSRNPGMEDERETSENETDAEDSKEMQNGLWHKGTAGKRAHQEVFACHLMPPAPGHERSGRETPVSVDSIPLEWDHTVDVGGSSSHEDEDDGTYYSALSDVEITESPEAYLKMTTKTLKASSGKSDSEAHLWHSSDTQTPRKHQYQQTEMTGNLLSTETDVPYKATIKSSPSDDLNNAQHFSCILSDEVENDEGLVGIAAAEKQSGVIERWEIFQAQQLSHKLRVKQNRQQWQQLNSDLSNITSWLERTEAELDDLQKLEPATSLQATEYKVKKLKEILKAFDNYKALVISANLSSREFLQTDNAESKELQTRLQLVNLHWDVASHSLDTWKARLQSDLMQCQDFHERSQALLLWLGSAENRRCKAQITDPSVDPHIILEGQRELMHLEKELLERQPEVHSLQEISSYLLSKSGEEDYVEADEKIHVISRKLQQLLKQVSQDLKTTQQTLDMNSSVSAISGLDSADHHTSLLESDPALLQQKDDEDDVSEATNEHDTRSQNQSESTQEVSRPRSLFLRVLRAALPLQLLFLLLLLLACMVPVSEEDYSCTHANNFARSFYPMLSYTNGPPPT
ncbi:nesprin-2 [Microcaecilia unicolor]|uniref:Nesprin-2-like n=1 Tax=Microcaecilia unicolor TaxID=1415580 RepID=A0A6P7Z562_9AMPH|nr:nesprin-2-like [Microcaecilia unicolor]